MRGIEVLLLAGFIGLIGIGVWNARQWLPQWGPRTVSSARTDTSKVPEVSASKKDAKTSRVRTKIAVGDNQIVPIDVANTGLPISKTEVDVLSSGFPTGKDLRVGTPGVQVRAQYGEPTARVTEMRSGRVFELYYYFNRDRTQLTMARLQSGVVVSAESILP